MEPGIRTEGALKPRMREGSAADIMSGALALSVVVPCHNEAQALPALLDRLIPAAEAASDGVFEIVLVDDGSTDDTAALMLRLQQAEPRLAVMILSRNFGHQAALSAGLDAACGQRVLFIDADLQDPPELLGEMMARMDAGADVVYGRRSSRPGDTVFKSVSARLFYRLLARIADVDLSRDSGDFRLISARVADVLRTMPEHHRYMRGLVSWAGFRQEPVDYVRTPRTAGETKYPLARMIRFGADAITGFSVMPLRLATWLGFSFAGVASLIFLYVLASWAMGASVQGWPSLMATVLLMGSVQLIVVGILGEYLGRLYIQSKGRPLYIVDRMVRTIDAPVRGQASAESANPRS